MFSRRAARNDDDADYAASTDDPDPGGDDTEVETEPSPRRRWWAPQAAGAEPTPEDLALKPTAMRGTEALYGYVVGLELIGVSILNLTVTHGKGAPTHPSTGLSVLGLAASIAFLGVVRTHHRFIVPFGAIVAAFFVTSLPKVPQSLSTAHLFALIVPIIYAFVLTQRQRKAAVAQGRGKRSSASRPAAAGGTAAPADRRAQAVSRRQARRQAAVPTGPQPNRRYTPPKAKRPRR